MDFTIWTLTQFAALVGALTIGTVIARPKTLNATRFRSAFLSAIITAPIVAVLAHLLWRTPLTTEAFVRAYLAQVFVIYALNPEGKSINPFVLTHVKDGHPFRIRFSFERENKSK